MPHQNCDCHDDAAQGSGTLSLLARSASSVVSGRVTKATARALGNYCSTHACTQSEALRKALVILSADNADPEKQLAAVAAALGLDPAATADQVQQAVAALIAALPPDPADGATEYADVPPVAPPGSPAVTSKLSAAELAACTRLGVSPADYLATVARARGLKPALSAAPARPSTSQLRADRELAAKLKARGLTPEQFETLKSKAVKTTR